MSVLDRFRLDGRTALITGGSRGLGEAMAMALAEAGADLILIGRQTEDLEATKSALTAATGRTVWIISGDLSTPEGAAAACDQALALGQAVDILINNVGGRRLDVSLETTPIEDWKRLVDLNLTSALVCCQKFFPGMQNLRRGSIINITSVAGPLAIKGIHGRHYEAAKAGLTALTKSLAADWAPYGIRANAIAPGVFRTAPNRRWFSEKPEFEKTFLDHIPMARLGEAHEIGPVALFLASDASSYITGATIYIDGGFTLW